MQTLGRAARNRDHLKSVISQLRGNPEAKAAAASRYDDITH
jgi:hypothetical protein